MNKATIIFVTGGSGGIGKSSGARMIAHAAGLTGLRVTLVDANPGQQSQRAFLHAGDRYALEHAYDQGLPEALAGPRAVNAPFAFMAGPADPYAPDMPRMYTDVILALRGLCDLIVVDADRTDPALWEDKRSIPGGLMRPMCAHMEARVLFRVGQSGSQVDDGLAALDAIRMPDRTGVTAVCPTGVRPLPDSRWRGMLDGMGRYLGCDRWDADSLRLIDEGRTGWPRDAQPAWLVNALMWAGVDVSALKPRRRLPWSR